MKYCYAIDLKYKDDPACAALLLKLTRAKPGAIIFMTCEEIELLEHLLPIPLGDTHGEANTDSNGL